MMGKMFMANLNASLTVHEKVDFLKFPRDWGEGSIPQLLILSSEMKDLH